MSLMEEELRGGINLARFYAGEEAKRREAGRGKGEGLSFLP
jgi:hypothetical protein